MALTKIETQNIEDGAISTPKLGEEVSASITLIQSVSDAANLIPAITSVNVANSTYDILDDTAVALDGGYIIINGSGFSSGAQVLIDGTVATSVTRVSSSQLQVQVPAKTAASYNLYVVNNTGHTAIRVNGLTYSATPTWVTGSTLDNQAVDVAFSVALDATGAVSYANTTALPAGTDLLSNGYFYGTVTGIVEETLYNFTVVAIDAENQDSPREFSVTVTVGPSYQLWSWGLNTEGQLGNNNITNSSSPSLVGSLTDWNNISVGAYHVLAVKSDGTLWAWGRNDFGCLGLTNQIHQSSPVQIGSLTNWNKIGGGTNTSIASKTDGTLWAWGQGYNGCLGFNLSSDVSSPTQVGSSTDWDEVEMGNYTTFAVKQNGTLWSWGDNTTGNLGHSNKLHKSSPTQVGASTDWSKVTAGSKLITAFIKTNGTLWTCGYNWYGTLGLNDRIYRSSPTQVGSDTTWNYVNLGSNTLLATKTDGTMWSCGYNGTGSLGLGNTINRSSPTQIGTATDWTLLNAKGMHYAQAALKTNGTLWTWGYSYNGTLGLNNATQDKSSPTQVGTDTNWSLVNIGYYSTLAFKEV